MTLYLQALTRAYMLASDFTEEEQVLAAFWEAACEREGVSMEDAEAWERATRHAAESDAWDAEVVIKRLRG